MHGSSGPELLVLRPTRQEFTTESFQQYCEKVFTAQPDLPCFKVVPPKGWSPRTSPMPSLDDVRIGTPIKQHVFGTKGAFRCVLEEQQGLTVSQFKKLAYSDKYQRPVQQGHRESTMDREFWRTVTMGPPYYGADTPHSFFDKELPFGWNLRDLKCLLSQHNVPKIPGVTTPMTYFGMWKSFFSWHVEDVDLYSINYLHFGARKVWYCVSPADRRRFEDMAKQQFPDLARSCRAFLRHKDVLLSPRVLRSYNIQIVQAHQDSGEFIVLNAGAYHSGYNQGFNCAEAVNFALKDWVRLGRYATQCTCSALEDAVRLDVRLFKPKDEQWTSDEESSEADEDDRGSEASSQTEGRKEGGPRRRSLRRKTGRLLEARYSGAGASRKRKDPPGLTPRTPPGRPYVARPRLSANGKRIGRPPKSPAAYPAAQHCHSLRRLTSAVQRRAPMQRKLEAAVRHTPPGQSSHVPRRDAARRTGAGVSGQERESSMDTASDSGTASDDSTPRATRRITRAVARSPSEARDKGPAQRRSAKRSSRATSSSGSETDDDDDVSIEASSPGPSEVSDDEPSAVEDAAPPDEEPVLDDFARPANPPVVIVGEHSNGERYFNLVIVHGDAEKQGRVLLRWLEEEVDGLFRLAPGVYEEKRAALLPVRTQWMPAQGRRRGGFKLLTLRSRILNTELVD